MKKWIFITVFFYFLAILAIYIDGVFSSYTKSHYAVVLGNQVLPDGTPSSRLQARLQRALALYREGAVKQVIVSGGTGREGFDEALVMKNWLQSQGLPETAVLVDSNGYTTRRTANNVLQLAQTDTPVIVVSQLYHLSRSKMAFRQAGFEHIGVAYPLYFEWRDVYSSFREVPAWLKYYFRW